LHVGIDAWGGTSYLDQFFVNPADPEKYDPASH
jgi:ribose transport system substrate-binding protein